jgi:hypothetical protein
MLKKKGGATSKKKIENKRGKGGNIGSCPHVPVSEPTCTGISPTLKIGNVISGISIIVGHSSRGKNR